MRLIAEIEPVGTMPPAIRERKGANRDRQRFERRRRTVPRRLTREHARDVGFEGNCFESVSAAGFLEADT
jgi:hypothetical protein